MITGQGFGSGRLTGHTFKNGFWNAIRYTLIAGMFAVLLTMIILLNEVMTFHNGIVDQVGERHARGVVLMLDEMNRHPEAYPEERTLPVAELAVELDGVRRALVELGQFAEIQPAASPPAQRTEAPVPSPGAGGSLGGSNGAEVPRDAPSEPLQIKLDRLRDTLYDASPFVAVAAALNEFKDSIQGLRHFEVQPGPAGAAGAGAEESGDPPAALVLEGQIKRMETELDSLAKVVRALPHADVLNGHLANLKGQIAALEDYQYATVHRRLAGGDETTEDNAAGKLAQIAPVVGRTASAAASETTGPTSASDGISGPPNAAEQERVEAEKEAGTEGGASADGRPNDVLQDSVASMESALRAAFPEFSLFSTVSGHVQIMRDQAHAFDRMTGSDYRGATDGPVDRETAEERFDQTREQLSKGNRPGGDGAAGPDTGDHAR